MKQIFLHIGLNCKIKFLLNRNFHLLIFTMITEVWPCANRAGVTNNSTVISKIVIIEVVLIEGFLYFFGLFILLITNYQYLFYLLQHWLDPNRNILRQLKGMFHINKNNSTILIKYLQGVLNVLLYVLQYGI